MMASGQTACFLRAANVGGIIAITDLGLPIFTDQATRIAASACNRACVIGICDHSVVYSRFIAKSRFHTTLYAADQTASAVAAGDRAVIIAAANEHIFAGTAALTKNAAHRAIHSNITMIGAVFDRNIRRAIVCAANYTARCRPIRLDIDCHSGNNARELAVIIKIGNDTARQNGSSRPGRYADFAGYGQVADLRCAVLVAADIAEQAKVQTLLRRILHVKMQAGDGLAIAVKAAHEVGFARADGRPCICQRDVVQQLALDGMIALVDLIAEPLQLRLLGDLVEAVLQFRCIRREHISALFAGAIRTLHAISGRFGELLLAVLTGNDHLMRTVVIACIGRLLIRMIAELIAADARSVFTLDARFNRRLPRFFTANFAENIMHMLAGLILERDIAISFVPLVFTGRIFAFPIELRRVGLVFCKNRCRCTAADRHSHVFQCITCFQRHTRTCRRCLCFIAVGDLTALFADRIANRIGVGDRAVFCRQATGLAARLGRGYFAGVVASRNRTRVLADNAGDIVSSGNGASIETILNLSRAAAPAAGHKACYVAIIVYIRAGNRSVVCTFGDHVATLRICKQPCNCDRRIRI